MRRPKTQRVHRDEETGEFPCPHCSVDRTYTLLVEEQVRGIVSKRSGHIVGVRVECNTCRNNYPGELRDRTLYRDRVSEQALLDRLRAEVFRKQPPD